jgi:hypothetical protein
MGEPARRRPGPAWQIRRQSIVLRESGKEGFAASVRLDPNRQPALPVQATGKRAARGSRALNRIGRNAPPRRKSRELERTRNAAPA